MTNVELYNSLLDVRNYVNTEIALLETCSHRLCSRCEEDAERFAALELRKVLALIQSKIDVDSAPD